MHPADMVLIPADSENSFPMKHMMLLVDDDEHFCHAFGLAMERRNIHCLSAHSADDAMTLIEQMHFTHAVIDLNLGDGDSGLTVLRYMAQVQPDCPAVMLTGYASIATAVEAARIGVVEYLPKPATAEEVLAAFSHTHTASAPPIAENPLTPKRLEWEYIQRTLLKNKGNISATARELGMHRRTLQRKLSKHPPAL